MIQGATKGHSTRTVVSTMTDTIERGTADVPHGTLAEIARDLAARPYARRGVPARTQPIRVMLVDDHHLVRAGLESVLHACADLSVVGEASDGEGAVAVTTRVRPEVVVMDLDMPVMDGLTATRLRHDIVPEVRVLIVTMYPEREKLMSVLDAGARGYLAKSAADCDLPEAIRVVASGEVYVQPAVARTWLTPPRSHLANERTHGVDSPG